MTGGENAVLFCSFPPKEPQCILSITPHTSTPVHSFYHTSVPDNMAFMCIECWKEFGKPCLTYENTGSCPKCVRIEQVMTEDKGSMLSWWQVGDTPFQSAIIYGALTDIQDRYQCTECGILGIHILPTWNLEEESAQSV